MYMNLAFRVDADLKMGIGHLMRCLALAQASKDEGGTCIFLMATGLKAVVKRLHEEKMEIFNIPFMPGSLEDATESAKRASEKGADWLVIDGYQFGTHYQKKIKDAGLNLLTIDDCGDLDHYFADIVVNQNLMACKDLYRGKEPYTQLLMGPEYILLRREFRKYKFSERMVPERARKILVTMGGTDPVNMTLKAFLALLKLNLKKIEITLILGGGNPNYRSFMSRIRNSSFPVNLEINPANMPEWMAWADMAIASGGTTAWELAFMGIPSLIIPIAKNQNIVVETLESAGAAINLGWYDEISEDQIIEAVERLISNPTKRKEMSVNGRRIVDGKGVDRILDLLKGKTIRLRKACMADCHLLWEWANEPEARTFSFSSGPIPIDEHVKWFNSKIKDPNYIILIATDQRDSPIGVVRFELDGKEAVISVNLDRRFRGMGYGKKIISIASRKLFETSYVEKITAYVKKGNENSYHAFLKAGFQDVGAKSINNHMAYILILER